MGDRLTPLPFPQLVKSPLRELMVRYYERRVVRGQLKVLFIVGHMRSGSTLLLHILNTNPGITGYGETHRLYGRPRDYGYLTFDVCRAFRLIRPPGPYVLDKVLYRDYIRRPEVLAPDYVKLVILVRPPEESIPSILRFQPRDIRTEQEALAYYVEQLQMVEEYARIKNDRGSVFFLTFDQLTNAPDRVLPALTQFLGLATPLTERYETIWSTGERGRRGLGDDSAEIKTGRIVRKRARPPVPLSPETVRTARAAYDHCVDTLPTLCAHAGNGGA